MTEPGRQLIEIASWRLVAEMIRRYPDLLVMESHPCGGFYDCLELAIPEHYRSHASAVTLNRVGSLHVHARGDDALFTSWENFWDDYLGAEDPREIVLRASTMAGLPDVGHLPKSTPTVLVFRFIATFLTHAFLGRDLWQCRNCLFGSSDLEEASRSPLFEKFPEAAHRLQVALEEEPQRFPVHRFWFLCVGAEPKLCLETSGIVWDVEGNEYRLENLYEQRRRMWPVVNFVARDLLP